jgi:uncharacterized RDD family membrane protein YckC
MNSPFQQWTRWIAGVSLLIGLTATAAAQDGSRTAAERQPSSGVESAQTPGRSAGRAAGARSGEGRASANSVDSNQEPSRVGFPTDADENFTGWRNTRPVLRIGQDYTVPAGTTVREVVVVAGDAVIDGRVDMNVVVVAGSVRLGPEARVRGSLVAVGTAATIAAGAVVEDELVVVGGGLDAPASFSAGGEQVVIGTAGLARAVQAALPWATQGLLLGRLIVPSLGWMWALVLVMFVVKLMMSILFERPVRASMEQLRTRPLSAVLVGLLVCLLVGPAFFILAVSVVGIVVIPFAVCALFVAGLLGKLAVARAIGHSVVAEQDPSDKLAAARSFAIGFALITVAYMVPVLGLMTYLFVGVFGLGAATMALFAGLRRENPAKPRPPKPLPTPPPVAPTPPPVSGAPAYAGENASPSVAFTALPSDSPSGVLPRDEVPFAAAGPSVTAAAAVPGALLSMPKAAFIVRAAAFAIDLIVVFFATVMLIDLDSPRELILMLLIYHVVFWAMKGTTLGGMVCNLRVIRTDGEPVTVGDATIRALSSILSLVVFGLGALWILFDPDRQAWHDRFAGTYVVVVPKHYRG